MRISKDTVFVNNKAKKNAFINKKNYFSRIQQYAKLTEIIKKQQQFLVKLFSYICPDSNIIQKIYDEIAERLKNFFYQGLKRCWRVNQAKRHYGPFVQAKRRNKRYFLAIFLCDRYMLKFIFKVDKRILFMAYCVLDLVYSVWQQICPFFYNRI